MKLDASTFVADETLIKALKAHSQAVPCEQDRILFKQGDAPVGLFIICGGVVELSILSASGQVVMDMRADCGSLLGLPGLIGNVGYSLSAKARKGADVCFVSREDFNKLMLSEPGISMSILKVLAAEVRTARIAAVSAA